MVLPAPRKEGARTCGLQTHQALPGVVIQWGQLLRETTVARCSVLLCRDHGALALGQGDSHPKGPMAGCRARVCQRFAAF